MLSLHILHNNLYPTIHSENQNHKNMKTTKLLFLMAMLLMGAIGVQAATKTAKAVLSFDGKTLTFEYNDQKYNPLRTKVYMLNSGTEAPGWLENKETITTVVFDSSFREATPTSCYKWFEGMSELTTIEMKNPSVSDPSATNYMNLNTSEVTTMNSMFSGCSKLETLPDLYRLSTSNVTDMSGMFKNCSALTSLNLADHSIMIDNERVNVQSRFITANVTTMASMFYNCSSLTSLNLTKFNTDKVTSMRTMFYNCSSLTTLRLGNFNTSLVEDMGFMFMKCNKLQTIVGLDNFDTSNVTTMQQMFAWCSGLKQLNLPFNTSSVEIMSFMFAECTSLVAADISSFDFPDLNSYDLFMGCTALSQLTVSATAANLRPSDDTPNSGSLIGVGTKLSPCYLICVGFTPSPEETGAGWFKWKGGYFTESLIAMPYAALKDNVLTFRYDDQKMALFSAGADVYPLNEALVQPGWRGCSATKVVFDPSFAEARPSSCAFWFYNMTELDSITDMKYLNTSEVTNMYMMFSYCDNLRKVDVSHFNTSKVENMNYMFYECWNLFNLDVSNFDLPEGNTYSMFKGSSINHLTVPECAEILNENACEGLGYQVNPWELICPAGFTPVPQEVDPEGNWIKWKGGYFFVSQMEPYAALKDSVLTFRYDAKKNELSGQGASVYSLNEGYDLPDWTRNPSVAANVTKVVFNASFAKVKPVSCAYWFNQMYKLKSIEGLEYLNTSEVTTMEQMFTSCKKLREVDVSHFNTSKVENMNYMFYECSNLFILDISNFDLPTENTDQMFVKSSINYLTVPVCAEVLSANACQGMGSQENPWQLICPAGFTPEPQETDLDGNWILWKGGYFTAVQKDLYAILEDNVLTFMYDLKKQKYITDGYTVFDLNDTETAPAWYNNRNVVTKVIFDESFARARPVSCRSWFYGMFNLQKIEGIENLNTSEVTTMHAMFYGCERLGKVDMSHFNTSKVTTMRNMFNGCTRLESLDLSHFDTSKVTTMYAMFHGCKALESLDLSHFDTSLVEDMSCMFMKSNKLTSIEGLDKFDTSNATTMYQMFYECSHLQQVDLSHFNTSKVENMAFMFIDCSSLTSANISNFEFKEGCINNNMFQDCTSLNKLYVSSSAANLRTYDTGNDPFDSGSCVGVGTETTPCILICSDGFNPVPEEEDSDGKWMKWKSGYFIVSPMGDVNEDGRLSVADVMLTVNRLLVHPVSIFNEGNADMNNDGRLSVADVMLMVKAITGQH